MLDIIKKRTSLQNYTQVSIENLKTDCEEMICESPNAIFFLNDRADFL